MGKDVHCIYPTRNPLPQGAQLAQLECMTLDLRVGCGAYLKKEKKRKIHCPCNSSSEKPSSFLLLSHGLSFKQLFQLPPSFLPPSIKYCSFPLFVGLVCGFALACLSGIAVFCSSRINPSFGGKVTSSFILKVNRCCSCSVHCSTVGPRAMPSAKSWAALFLPLRPVYAFVAALLKGVLHSPVAQRLTEHVPAAYLIFISALGCR